MYFPEKMFAGAIHQFSMDLPSTTMWLGSDEMEEDPRNTTNTLKSKQVV